MFKILYKSKKSQARVGKLITSHGEINSPFFMPIATRGAVKNLVSEELKDLGAEIILSNTYHLLSQPGIKLMKKIGGLHNFMNWFGPILTDSGGFQVFSLSQHRKITAKGVSFQDPRSGRKFFLSPEKVIKIQLILGSDIMMVLDECAPYPSTKQYIKKSVALTTNWAARCKLAYSKWQMTNSKNKHNHKPLLFGIIQGGIYKDLRLQSVRDLLKVGFSAQGPLRSEASGPASGWDGYAIGGVAVGEPRKYRRQILEWVVPRLPVDKPRYLMGVGKPEEIIEAVRQGIDMFDCVIPTREARHGRLYLWPDKVSLRGPRLGGGRSNPINKRRGLPRSLRSLAMTKGKSFYTTINITNAKFANDLSPINNTNLKQYSKAYLHHLFKTKELLAMRLATLNNLRFYLDLMGKVRDNIKGGRTECLTESHSSQG